MDPFAPSAEACGQVSATSTCERRDGEFQCSVSLYHFEQAMAGLVPMGGIRAKPASSL